MDELLQSLGGRIRSLRREQGLTLRALAASSDLSVRFLGDLENGRGNIAVGRLARLADALGTSTSVLVSIDPSDARRRRIASKLARVDGEELDRIEQLLDAAPLAKRSKTIVALLGVRGAGKSTVGRRLAGAMGLPFVELDARIERSSGLSLAEVFAIHGEAYYRQLEHEALRDLLDTTHGAVVATGGSLVTHPETWALLKRRTRTLWLRAQARDLWERVVAQGDLRPMERNPHAFSQLESLLSARAPLYAEADQVVETSGRSEDEVLRAALVAAQA